MLLVGCWPGASKLQAPVSRFKALWPHNLATSELAVVTFCARY